MANSIADFITLKDSDHPRMLYALTKIQLDDNYIIDFKESHNVAASSKVNYKVTAKQGASLGTIYLTYQVPLHISWTDPTFPSDHYTEVNLYDVDGTTLVNSKTKDTKDSPVLR